MKRLLLFLGLGLLALFVLIQVVPYGEGRTNPPVVAEPEWDSPETRELFYRACSDCHSNETRWPWYSRVAPASWFLQDHVHEAREHFNVSEWNRPQDDAHEAAEEVEEGKMPLKTYLPLHADARLSDADRETLIRGLEATFGTEEDESRGADHAESDPGESDPGESDPGEGGSR